MRAIAVGLVLLNHLWPTRLPGGYVGVDIFFVISGFLITAHLLAEYERNNRIALPQFYARRARRLLPAALLVGLASLIGTALWLPAERWERIAREVFASAAYVENWLLAASSVDYFAQSEAPTPAQHYWSLSVEEQFYVLWPLTLLGLSWVLARFARRRRGAELGLPPVAGPASSRQGLAIAMIGLIIVSFGCAVWLTAVQPSAAYFNTLARAWEFLLGGLVAVCAPFIAAWMTRVTAAGPVWRGTLGTLRGVAQLIGYLAIAGSALAFDQFTTFPGPWAALPAVATALIIVAGPETPRWSPARLLEWRPVQYTGDISYALYLWHWPLIVFAPFVLSRELRFVDRVALLALSFVLAALTKHFIEDPGRTRLFAGARPRRTLLAMLGSVAVMGALAWGMGAEARSLQAAQAAKLEALSTSDCFGAGALPPSSECGDPFGPALVAPQGERNAPWSVAPAECAIVSPDRQILAAGNPSLVECDFAGAVDKSTGEVTGEDRLNKPLNVWLVGDSHAEHLKAPVYELARSNEWRVTATMQGGCPILPVPLAAFEGSPTSDEKRENCRSWSQQVSERLIANAPDLVLVSNFAAAELVDDGTGRPQTEQLAEAMAARFGEWTAAGADVVVIRDAPVAGALIGPDCVVLSGARSGGCTAPIADVLAPDPMFDAVSIVNNQRVTRVDLTDRFCVDGTCSGIIGGMPVFYDANHLSPGFAKTLAPGLEAALEAALGGSPAGSLR